MISALERKKKHASEDARPTDFVLRVRDLETKFFTKTGTVDAVSGVSFDLKPGERMAVVGESGSGKSVMAMSLIRLVSYPGRIVNGDVELNGRGIMDLSKNELNHVRGKEAAMVFQDPMTSLNPVIKIEDQMVPPMMRHLGLSQRDARERALDLLRMVGIPDEADRLQSYPHEMSGGMRQRVLIAIALSCKPSLLLADEPTTALDVTIQAQIVALLKQLSDETGTAVLFVTHDLGLVARFAQKIAVMYAGRIVEQGDVHAIYSNPQHPYTRALLKSVPPLAGARQDRLAQIEGAPPDLKNLGLGCAFAPRCTMAVSRCSDERPVLQEVAPSPPAPRPEPAEGGRGLGEGSRSAGHLAACWVTQNETLEVEAVGSRD